MINEEVKKTVMSNLLDIIADISNKDYQTKSWIYGMGPNFNDFTEIVCQFFDFGEPVLSNYKAYNVTEHQYVLLKNFYKKFDEFTGNNHWPPEFIDSPEWAEIIDEAKKVLETFHYKKNSI